MDYKKMFDKLVEQVDKEKIGRNIVGEICPGLLDLSEVENCVPYSQNSQTCCKCWAKALGLGEK